ncbi:CBS domain-containing protein [Aneurinibacillus tyrosinisolvens]|uniref:CBS domain-containing protein n=1 Tax=Aneurinibacillus tyrosinisolvens TaxID=1443435 RepID=UPI00063FCEFF|nr:CBS domain-containing protein [Aneurinibacillus tyrosinisolvens]
MAKKLRDIMTSNIATVTQKDNLYEAAVKMKEHNVGIIPVVDEQNKCIGLITDRDIVIRAIADKNPPSTSVVDIMSERLISGEPDMSVSRAAEIMAKEKVRRLPVLENGTLVGMVAMADLTRNKETQDEAAFAIEEVSEPTTIHSQGYMQ